MSHLPIEALRTRAAPGRAFVETGTFDGSGVDRALASGLFDKVHTVEIDSARASAAKHRFKGESVSVWCGNSADKLELILDLIAGPCTFWLDAHSDTHSPLLQELEAIRRYGDARSTILIDDLRLMPHADELAHILKSINRDFLIERLDGCIPGDVLCASVPR